MVIRVGWLFLVVAVRAWALVAAAVRACLTDHGRIYPTDDPGDALRGANVPLLGRPLGHDRRTASRAEVRATRDLRFAGYRPPCADCPSRAGTQRHPLVAAPIVSRL